MELNASTPITEIGTLVLLSGTFTHALLQSFTPAFSSPAIDAGNPALPGSIPSCRREDQRGVARPLDGNGDFISRCDIGAFEATPLASDAGVPFLEPAETTASARQNLIYTFTWTVPGPGWRVLDSLHLRIRDEQGTALWLRFQEVPGTLGTFSLVDPETGEPGPAFAAGPE